MTLKQVVFPAPLGPIRPRISPFLISKATSLRATTPPNRRVTLSTTSRASPFVGRRAAAGFPGSAQTSAAASSASCLRSSNSRARRRLGTSPCGRSTMNATSATPKANGRHSWNSRKRSGQVGDQERAEHGTDHVAGTADDDHGHEEERQVECEPGRFDVGLLAGEEQPRHRAENGTDGEGPQLELERVDAHHGGGVLVLADRQPGATDPAVLETPGQEDHQHEDAQSEPVPVGGLDRWRSSSGSARADPGRW